MNRCSAASPCQAGHSRPLGQLLARPEVTRFGQQRPDYANAVIRDLACGDQRRNGQSYRRTSAGSGWLRKAVGLAVRP